MKQAGCVGRNELKGSGNMFNIEKMCFNCFHEKANEGICPYCGFDNADNTGRYPGAMKNGSILNGQYIVGRVLGQGGFGITYLAWDYQLEIKVAIKEYLPDGMATRLPGTTLVSVYTGEKQENFDYGSDRFLDEARVLAKFLGNRYIVGVKSYFRENNTAYFVMDYIEGINFKNYIKNHGGKISYKDAMRILIPVMDALATVHREGVIHRDVTPDNIYITKDDEIKLLDFGSARYSLGDKSRLLDVILKAGYAPKEQYIRKGKQGPYTDIYSLAACFYASITGFLPPEALERMEEDELIPISARGIPIPTHIEAAIMKGLAVNPEYRFQRMEDFKAAMAAPPVATLPHETVPAAAPAHVPIPLTANEPVPASGYSIKLEEVLSQTPVAANEPIPVPEVAPSYEPILPASSETAPIIELVQADTAEKAPSLEPVTAASAEITPAKEPVTAASAEKAPLIESVPAATAEKAPERSAYPAGMVSPAREPRDPKLFRRNALLITAACVLLSVIVISIYMIMNGTTEDTKYVSTGGGGGGDRVGSTDLVAPGEAKDSSEPTDLPTQLPEVTPTQAPVQTVTIELVIDSNLIDYISLINDSLKGSEQVEVIITDNVDDFKAKTQVCYTTGTTSISVGFFNKSVTDEAASSGSIVKISSIVKGLSYIITAVDDSTASDIIKGLKPVMQAIAEDIEKADEEAASEAAAAKPTETTTKEEKPAPTKTPSNSSGSKDSDAGGAAKEDNKCDYCNGTGKVECTWCDGTGICKITHEDEDGGYVYEGSECPKKVTCPICDGTGKK